jgi:predicted nucleic acid-binding protein
VPQAEAAAASWKRTIESGGISFYEDTDVLTEAGQTAGRLQHALQDCLYLELARKLGYTPITGARVFGKKAAATYPNIVVL